MCKHTIKKKMLKKKYGKIINKSIVGHTGNLGQANYLLKLELLHFQKV